MSKDAEEPSYELTLKGLLYDLMDEDLLEKILMKMEIHALRKGYKIPAVVLEDGVWVFRPIGGALA